MTKSEGIPNDKIRMTKQRPATDHAAVLVLWPWTFFGHLSLVICPSPAFPLRCRCDAKRIEPPFATNHAPDGQRHADASVPRRQVTAFSGFSDSFPLAAIRTHGELETIPAGCRHAQINTRPDDAAQFGHGFVPVLFAMPHDGFAFADRYPKRIRGIAKRRQTGKSAQLQVACIDDRRRFVTP